MEYHCVINRAMECLVSPDTKCINGGAFSQFGVKSECENGVWKMRKKMRFEMKMN